MKRLLIVVFYIGLCVSLNAQKLVLEAPYAGQGYKFWPSITRVIPLKDGGFFCAYTELSSPGSANHSQAMVAVDQDGKKLFEIHLNQDKKLKIKKFQFIYHAESNQIFGFNSRFTTSDIAKIKFGSSMICIQMDGTYKFIDNLPMNRHLVAATAAKDKILLFGLSDENAEVYSEVRPSGKMDVVLVDVHTLDMEHKNLDLPEFKSQRGVSNYKILGIKDDLLYMVTEKKLAKGKEDIFLVYEFYILDILKNEIVKTQQIPIEMGEVCPRASESENMKDNPSIVHLKPFALNLPSMYFDSNKADIYVLSSYGKGYPSNILKRFHEGCYVIKFDKNLEYKYSKILPAPRILVERVSNYRNPDNPHLLRYWSNAGKDYLLERAGEIVHLYAWDMETGDIELDPACKADSPFDYAPVFLGIFFKEQVEMLTKDKKKRTYSLKFFSDNKKNYATFIDIEEKMIKLYLLDD